MFKKILPLFLLTFILVDAQDDRITFIVVGDWGAEFLSEQDTVAAAMDRFSGEYGAQFVISTGDNFYQWGVDSINDEQFDEKWRWVYNTTNLVNLPWYITVGNHDYSFNDGREWFQVNFSYVEPRWIFPHLWHSFTMSAGGVSALFVLFDTECYRQNTNDWEEQFPWINRTFAESSATVKMLLGHREIFAAGDKGAISNRNYNNLQPILDANNVPFYVCGHDHNLQHIHSNDRTQNKVDYIISGGGGNIPYLKEDEKEIILNEVYNMNLATFIEDNGFIGVIIDQTRTTFKFYDLNYNEVYEYSRNHGE